MLIKRILDVIIKTDVNMKDDKEKKFPLPFWAK